MRCGTRMDDVAAKLDRVIPRKLLFAFVPGNRPRFASFPFAFSLLPFFARSYSSLALANFSAKIPSVIVLPGFLIIATPYSGLQSDVTWQKLKTSLRARCFEFRWSNVANLGSNEDSSPSSSLRCFVEWRKAREIQSPFPGRSSLASQGNQGLEFAARVLGGFWPQQLRARSREGI